MFLLSKAKPTIVNAKCIAGNFVVSIALVS